ncbi:MAG TPA: hypothetical protein VGG90_13855 [Candidatus Dormibacteraeota bacterium]|jgi:hypothetical protein
MSLTIREPQRLVLAIDRIHDRWFDVDAITYDPNARVVRIPYWNKTTSKAPLNPATGDSQSFDSLLSIHDTDKPRVEDKERIGTYAFNVIAYSNGRLVITAEPNLRISCSVRSLHIEFGPDAIDQLVAKLARYPEAEITRAESSISIRPPRNAGFTIDLHVDADHYSVFFDGGWHEEFETEEEALNCVGFGLSSSCRLTVTYRGSTPCRWAVQSREGGDWKTDSVTGLLIFPFWRRPRIAFKQNDLVASASQEPR